IKSAAAAKLNCSRTTLYVYLSENPEIGEALEEIKEELKDLAEGKVLQSIKSGDMQTVRWFLEFQAKDRGYNRRVEMSGPGGGPIETRQEPPDLSGFTEEELE